MAKQIKTKRGLVNLYNSRSSEIKSHFEHLPSLLDKFPMEVALGYTFHRLELGQTMALYIGVVKEYRANTKEARKVIDAHNMTRKNFMDLYHSIYNIAISPSAISGLRTAEKTRDTIMHGGVSTEERMRNAIARVLEYGGAVNKQLNTKFKIKPFSGNYKGFAGSLKKLDARTTGFMLKGMGFKNMEK